MAKNKSKKEKGQEIYIGCSTIDTGDVVHAYGIQTVYTEITRVEVEPKHLFEKRTSCDKKKE